MKKERFLDEGLENVDDESIYSERVREQLLEDDEISPMEIGFMQGYDEAV